MPLKKKKDFSPMRVPLSDVLESLLTLVLNPFPKRQREGDRDGQEPINEGSPGVTIRGQTCLVNESRGRNRTVVKECDPGTNLESLSVVQRQHDEPKRVVIIVRLLKQTGRSG